MKAAFLQPSKKIVGIRVFSRRAGRIDMPIEQLERVKARGLPLFSIEGHLELPLGKSLEIWDGVPTIGGPIRRLPGYDTLAGYFLVSEMGWGITGGYASMSLSMDTLKRVAEQVVGRTLFWHTVPVARLALEVHVLTDRSKGGFVLNEKRGANAFSLSGDSQKTTLKGNVYVAIPAGSVKEGRFPFQLLDNVFTSFFSDGHRESLLTTRRSELDKDVKYYSEIGVTVTRSHRLRNDARAVAGGLTSHAVTSLGGLFRKLSLAGGLTPQQKDRYSLILSAFLRDRTGNRATILLQALSRNEFEDFRFYLLTYEGKPVF